MRYTISNVINRPLAEVIETFKDTEGAKQWMQGLQRIEPLSGTPGEVGAKTNFHFLFRKREMVIEETILEQNFPKQIKFAYRSSMGYNEVEMVFEEESEHSTRQINHSYFELKGFMKWISFLTKGMYKKQSLTYLNAFRDYCEEEK